MHRIQQTRALVAGAVGAIAASQTTSGSAALLINGSLASGGVATMATQQTIGITSTGALSGINFVIAGTDGYGRVIGETLVGPANSTVKSVLNYKTVTSIQPSSAVGTAVTVDTVGTGASGEIPIDQYQDSTEVTLTAVITGTLNVTAQFTTDDIWGNAPGPFTWFPVTSMTTITSTTAGTIISPVTAVRILTNSGTGTVVFSVIQGGMQS